MTVGDRIKEIRTEKDIAQTDLAIRCGISKQTLYKYEMNIVTNIPLKTISKIAKELNVSESFLMGWEEPKDIIEMAETDVALSNMNKRMKEYAMKMAKMPAEDQEFIMQMIDKLENKKGE